ncbi:MAG: hypothetical protein RL477_1439 [Pseudomonadota bacterium]|jgi:3-oxoadipate enol-lactonase
MDQAADRGADVRAVSVRGTAFNARIDGARAGAPWLTFSNSHATDIGLWDAQATLLSRDFRILRYDTRGHGHTPPVPGPCDMAALAADVVGIWDALGIEASHVVGLSLGGTTGLELAARYPGRVLSLAACDCRHTATDDFRAAWEPRIALALDKGMAALVAPTVERWFTAAFHRKNPPELARVREMIGATSVDGYVAGARALQGIDAIDRLSAIRCPVLALGGAFDPPAPPALMADMAARIKGARHEVIADAAHMSHLEQPVAFSRAIGEFLAAVA